MTGLISTADRFPEDGMWVLACRLPSPIRWYQCRWFVARHFSHDEMDGPSCWGDDNVGEFQDDEVTHWMPLPGSPVSPDGKPVEEDGP